MFAFLVTPQMLNKFNVCLRSNNFCQGNYFFFFFPQLIPLCNASNLLIICIVPVEVRGSCSCNCNVLIALVSIFAAINILLTVYIIWLHKKGKQYFLLIVYYLLTHACLLPNTVVSYFDVLIRLNCHLAFEHLLRSR